MKLRAQLRATNWLAGVSYAGGECDVVHVQFKNTRAAFYLNPNGIPLEIGDMVVVEAAPGHDVGKVSMVGPLVKIMMRKAGITEEVELKKIFRHARAADLEKFEEARAREHDTMIRSRQIAAELELNMKIGDVEYQGDGGKAIFYYIADERVDFRKLIRILADTFKVRIEMKQIGARQEAGRIGGIGPCGRPLCCSSWLNKFVSVGTGAARLQDLSMNPQKLAGQCAKLKCCLNFETDVYSEASAQLPPRDVELETADATYYYFKADILAGKVTYSTDKKNAVNLVTIPAQRAMEVIDMNKAGVKPISLNDEDEAPKEKDYIDLTDQDSLTRFDKSKKKKKKHKPHNQQGQKQAAAGNQGENQSQGQHNHPNKKKKKKKKPEAQ